MQAGLFEHAFKYAVKRVHRVTYCKVIRQASHGTVYRATLRTKKKRFPQLPAAEVLSPIMVLIEGTKSVRHE
jgi:hypothetical protein